MPPDWTTKTAAAQRSNSRSFFHLYREALRVRRTFAGSLRWLRSPRDVLVFERPSGLVSATNLSSSPVPLDLGDPILASTEMSGSVLPPDTTAWFLRL